MKTKRVSCWVIYHATNGNLKPRVTIEGVYKTSKQAEAKLKWLGCPEGYFVQSSYLHIEEEKEQPK